MAKRKRSRRNKRSSHRRKQASPALQVNHRLLQGGPEYMEENIIRLLLDSARLQQEPEFAGFYFDLEQTLVVSSRQFNRFHKRLNKAAKTADEDAFVTTYDDYRIAVIDVLATPEFRQQLEQKLEQCNQRLAQRNNVELFETATFVSVFLNSKEQGESFPLGIYGLITTIYEASFDQAILKVPHAREIVSDDLQIVWQASNQAKDMEVLEQAALAADSFDEFLKEVDNKPELKIALQRQQQHLLKELQQKTIGEEMWFSADFFTPAEIKMSQDKMETKYLSKPWHLSRYISFLAIYNYFKCIRQTLEEIVIPQRLEKAIAWWQDAGQKIFMVDEDHWRALVPHIAAVIKSLQATGNSGHNILAAMYVTETLELAADTNDLSPRMQKMFNRLENSFFLKLLVRE